MAIATDELSELLGDLALEIERLDRLDIKAATLDEESLSGVSSSCITACECPTDEQVTSGC